MQCNQAMGCRGSMFGLAHGVVGLARTMQKWAVSAPAVQKNRSHAANHARSVHVRTWGQAHSEKKTNRLTGEHGNQSHSAPSLIVYERVTKQKALTSSKPGQRGPECETRARLRWYGNQSGPRPKLFVCTCIFWTKLLCWGNFRNQTVACTRRGEAIRSDIRCTTLCGNHRIKHIVERD
jgi:hypothetical protein